MKTRRHLNLLLTIAVLFPALTMFAQTDMTSLIVNPSFETGDYTGWTWTGWTGGWQTVNNDGDKTKDGTYIAGHWNNNIADVECSQDITGLANGYYMVTAFSTVSNNRLTNQRLFANNSSMLYGEATAAPYTELNLAILGGTESFTFGGYPTVTTENGPFKKLSVVSHVTDGILKLGFRFSGKGSALGYDFSYSTRGDAGFFKFDNFRLIEVSTVATVDTITLSDGSFDSKFDSTTSAINATLPVGTESVTPSVKLTVAGTTVSGAGAVNVSSGSGVSTITVTALDGTTTKTYTINYKVLALSDNNKLADLTVSSGTLFPVFNANDTVYTVLVPIGTATVSAVATPSDVLSNATGDGEVTLVNGIGKSNIVVTAESGNKKTYTINYDWAYITNPSFETADTTGWTWNGTTAGYVWVGVNADGDATKHGTYILGTWNSVFGDVELSQTLTGIPNGNYKITCGLMGSSNTGTSRLTTQRLFANEKSMLFGVDTMYSAENLAIMAATESYSFGGYSETRNDAGPFCKLSVTVPVTDGTVKLGVRTNGKSSTLGYTFPKLTAGDGHGWFKVDNFTMTYDGPLASISSTTEQVVTFQVREGKLFVKNVENFSVYNLQGVRVADVKSNVSSQGVALRSGFYIVKANAQSFKVVVK